MKTSAYSALLQFYYHISAVEASGASRTVVAGIIQFDFLSSSSPLTMSTAPASLWKQRVMDLVQRIHKSRGHGRGFEIFLPFSGPSSSAAASSSPHGNPSKSLPSMRSRTYRTPRLRTRAVRNRQFQSPSNPAPKRKQPPPHGIHQLGCPFAHRRPKSVGFARVSVFVFTSQPTVRCRSSSPSPRSQTSSKQRLRAKASSMHPSSTPRCQPRSISSSPRIRGQ